MLVVDDMPEIAERFASLIADSGDFGVVEAVHDGSTAIARIQQVAPLGVVLDLNMPGVGGLEVLRAIRTLRVPCKVAIVSSQLEPAIVERCLAEGADHVLSKSAAAEALPEIARTWLLPTASSETT